MNNWETPELLEEMRNQETRRALETNLEKNSKAIRELLGLPSEVNNIRISIDGFGKRKDGSYGWIFQQTLRADVQ